MFTSFKNRTQSMTKGFTLIELLVVIAIIGILSSVVLASLGVARSKARDATRISDVKNIRLALELYYDTAQAFPENENGTGDANQLTGTTLVAAIVPTYIPLLPADPLAASRAIEAQYLYVGLDALGADCSVAGCASYALGVTMERADNTVLDTDTGDNVVTGAFRGLGQDSCNTLTPGTDGVDETCYSQVP